MAIKLGGVESEIKKKGLIKGLFLGVIVVAMNIISFYYMTGTVDSHPMLVLPASFIFTIIIPLITIVLFILNIRKSIGGFWSFRQAATAIFIMLFTTYILLTIGRDILFVKLVEPNIGPKIGEVMIKSRMYKDQHDGMNATQIAQDLAGMKSQINVKANNDVWTIISGISESILIIFALAIILTALFKREAPPLSQETVR